MDEKIITVLEGINPKVSVIPWAELELVCAEAVFQEFSQETTKTPRYGRRKNWERNKENK